MFQLVASEFLFLCHFEENLLRSANHVGQIVFCWYTEPVLEQSLVYLPFQRCDISDISLQPNCLCVSLCGAAEICLPNIPATALAAMLFSSCTAKHTTWDRGTLLHPAAVFSLGESCITRVVRKDPPPALHRETQPSPQNRGLVPLLRCSCSDCRHWVAQAWNQRRTLGVTG